MQVYVENTWRIE